MTTAISSYRQQAVTVSATIAELHAALERHAARAEADPQNWAFAGDLQHITALVEQALNFAGAAK